MLTADYPSTFDAAASTEDQVAVGRVRITPNRRQLDNRFPVLGFTVDTGGLPYFEVLLATDASLFDPANAANSKSRSS